jgi:hypothetical protein
MSYKNFKVETNLLLGLAAIWCVYMLGSQFIGIFT